ncbi:MAG: hypothetical protein JW861_03565, partial [Bacteroidales bacterium]|nr:hypothetical protein [Bacteroidales bacterium]
EINLREVALHNKVASAWRKNLNLINDDPETEDGSRETKLWEFKYGSEKSDIMVFVLNFRMGNIYPEEFLYIIDNYLTTNNTIDSILFADTAQLRTRFPLLAKDPLFIPSLVDIIKSRGIFSVFIDVMEDNKYNEALMASADCRIFIDERKQISINNVRGKKYIDNLYKIDTVTGDTEPPELLFSIMPIVNYIKSDLKRKANREIL